MTFHFNLTTRAGTLLRILMTLFNKVGREFNGWLDNNLDGWNETIIYLSVKILLGAIVFSGFIVLIAWDSL